MRVLQKSNFQCELKLRRFGEVARGLLDCFNQRLFVLLLFVQRAEEHVSRVESNIVGGVRVKISNRIVSRVPLSIEVTDFATLTPIRIFPHPPPVSAG